MNEGVGDGMGSWDNTEAMKMKRCTRFMVDKKGGDVVSSIFCRYPSSSKLAIPSTTLALDCEARGFFSGHSGWSLQHRIHRWILDTNSTTPHFYGLKEKYIYAIIGFVEIHHPRRGGASEHLYGGVPSAKSCRKARYRGYMKIKIPTTLALGLWGTEWVYCNDSYIKHERITKVIHTYGMVRFIELQ